MFVGMYSYMYEVIIPLETEGYRFGLSVRLSHFEGRCFVDITSPSMGGPRGVFRSFSLQARIVGVQRQGFSLIGQKIVRFTAL